MKNKKLLNIFILLLSLVTLITNVLLFAFPAYGANTSTLFVVLFWVFDALTLVCLLASILITLIALFMDDYICSKMTEAFVLVAFATALINTIIFALSKNSLTFLYALVVILTFVTANISQVLRLLSSAKTWGADFKALVKTHKPQNKEVAEENVEEQTEENTTLSDENGDVVTFNFGDEE